MLKTIDDYTDAELNFGYVLILKPLASYSNKEIKEQYTYRKVKRMHCPNDFDAVGYYFNNLIKEIYAKKNGYSKYSCKAPKIYIVDSSTKWMVGVIKDKKSEFFCAAELNAPQVRQLAFLNNQYEDNYIIREYLKGLYSNLDKFSPNMVADNVVSSAILDCRNGSEVLIQQLESQCATDLAQMKRILNITI